MKVNPQLFVRVSASFAVICAVMLWPGASQVYQLPKGAAFVAAMVVCMSALAFSRDGFDMDLASCVLTMFYLYTVSRLLFSTANPSFIYGLTYFSPLFFFAVRGVREKHESLLFLFSICALAAFICEFYQFFFLHIKRPGSLFGNPIFFAEFTGAAVFYSIAAAAARPRLILLPAAAVILAIPAMIISSSRGPIVALTGAAAVFTILLYVRPVSAGFLRGAITLVIASSALFCLFCLVPSFNNELRSTADRFRLAAAPSSADVSRRACFALTGARIFSESPLSGCGPGCIKKHFQSAQAGILSTGGGCVFSSTSYLHNDYLQTACDTGAAGLLLLLLFIFSIPFSRGFVRSIKTGKGYTERVCYFSVIIFYMIESFFNFPLFSFPSAPLFFAAAGLASRDENNGKRHKIPSNLVTAAVLLTPVVVFFAAVKPNAFAADFYYKAALSGSAPVELSEKYYRKSCALENDNFDVLRSYAGFLAAAGRYEDAIVVYRRLLDIFPYSADALFNSAVCLQRAGKTREAFVYYNKTLYLNPQLLQARYELRSMDGPGRGSPDRTSPSIQDPGVNENGATGSQRMLLFMESGTP